MEPLPPLTPTLIEHGTVASLRDMVRALETIEGLTYTYSVDGAVMAEGRATLVKLMADMESATMLVNGCLFLNVASFRYLNFHSTPEGTRFELHGDGTILAIAPTEEAPARIERRRDMRMLEEDAFDTESYVTLDEDDEEDF